MEAALPDDWFELTVAVSPLKVDRLHCFKADFSFPLGAWFADPDHPTALGAGHVFIEDKLDHLAAPKIETSTQPETFSRRINDEAGESLRLAVQIDDQAGAPLRRHARRAAALGAWQAGHSFTPVLEVVIERFGLG
jgi:hypothetical protein